MSDFEVMAVGTKAQIDTLVAEGKRWEERCRDADERAHSLLQDLTDLEAQRDTLARQLREAVDHAGQTRAVLYRIVDVWDGPLYKHQMKPTVDWARRVLAGETEAETVGDDS